MKNVFSILFGILTMINYSLSAQPVNRHDPIGESLNSSSEHTWVKEAKIALCIFWEPYSVPKEFLDKNYGKAFIYQDIADQCMSKLSLFMWVNPKISRNVLTSLLQKSM